jgi:4-amino-4-deoxy-L-arabinose transferase-like glycosyltransferase
MYDAFMQKFHHLFPLFLFLTALLVRLIGVFYTQFDGLYGQDSFAYFNYALVLREAIGAGNLLPPFFWPIGYPALVALATLITGPQPFAGQLVSLLAGAAIAPMVYLIVLEYSRTHSRTRPGALIAGMLAAVAAQLLLSSLSIMADTAALFWGTFSALCMIRYERHLSLKWLALAALTLAFAILTRWVYALLALPWGLSALMAWHAARASLKQRAVAVIVAVAVCGSIFVLHFAAGVSRNEISYIGNLTIYSWNPANAFQREMINADGYFHYEYATGHFYARPTFHPAYIFPLFVPFWIIGLWGARREKLPLLAVLVGWPLIVYLFLAGIPWQNWRFSLTFFPPLLILVGLGVDWLWKQLPERWRPLLQGYCALALLGSVLWTIRDAGNFTAWANQNRLVALDVSRQLPPNAMLLAFGLTATMQHYTDVDTTELFYLTEDDLREITDKNSAASTDSGRTVYLLLEPDIIRTQWAGKSPAQNLDWLQAYNELTSITQYGSYMLYQVTP